MSELEERLNQILSSPEDMERIIGIARTIAASTGAGSDARQVRSHLPAAPRPPAARISHRCRR